MNKATRWVWYLFAAFVTALLLEVPTLSHAQKKPNILVIFGDDIGITNVPPRSFLPSFVPTTIMEETLDDIGDARKATPKPK